MTLRRITLVLATAALLSAQADVALQRAIRTETLEGDLKGAITQYGELAEGSDRAIAAQALIRMAGCYEKLGTAQARVIYERVVRDYADQTEAVSVARARLGGEPTVRAKGDRVVWAGENALHSDGRVSPDGRYVSYTDWFLNGNLMLHDLESGTTRSLTPDESWQDNGNSNGSTFSPDGKRVAYGWQNYTLNGIELRIVDVEGGSLAQPSTLFRSKDIQFMDTSDWSRDGEWIALVISRRDLTGQIGLLRVKDGSLKILKTVGWRGPNKLFFSPDGKYLAYDLPASETESQRDVYIIAVDGSGETPAVVHRAHDTVIGWSPDGSELLFASNRTGTVGIWEVAVSNGKPQGAPSLLKPDTGWVSPVGMTESGALYVCKDTSTVGLRLAPIDLEAGKLAGSAVVESYRSTRPDWTRDGRRIAYKTQQLNGDNVLSIRSLGSGDVRNLPTGLQYFTEPRWSPDGRFLVAGGRDLKGRPAIYKFDPDTGAASFLVAGRHVAHPEVSPDGKKIYYQDPERRRRRNYIEVNLDSEETRTVFTKPENAQIGRKELSPDGRFLAAVDRPLDPEKSGPNKTVYLGTTSLLLIPVDGGEPRELFRVAKPEWLAGYGGLTWTPDSSAILIFKKIFEDPAKPQGQELWLVPIEGGEPRRLDIDVNDWDENTLRVHPNGKQIAFQAGKRSEEIWVLENLIPHQNASR